MALFTEGQVRDRARTEVRLRGAIRKADQIIVEAAAQFTATSSFDVFLSHSIRDAELVLGAKAILEDFRLSVYVDWIDDPQLDRSRVTAATAEKLRQRMRVSKALFFLTTTNASASKWMPWECGFFDGSKEKVAILPVQAASFDNSFSGQEYLGLYPYVLSAQSTDGVPTLWVFANKNRYTTY